MADSAQNETMERVPYAVLGCGSTGYHVLQELRSSASNILVIDKNDERVRDIPDQGIDAVRRDISAVRQQGRPAAQGSGVPH